MKPFNQLSSLSQHKRVDQLLNEMEKQSCFIREIDSKLDTNKLSKTSRDTLTYMFPIWKARNWA